MPSDPERQTRAAGVNPAGVPVLTIAGNGLPARARRSAPRFQRPCTVALALLWATLSHIPRGHAAAPSPANNAETFAAVDRIFADYALDAHIPGLVYGIVSNGQLVYVRGIGVQDLESNRPVSADTLFRIASMTKAFTALTVLKLRDEGKLRLDAPAETYIPQLRGWKYPTEDSPRIRVRDLLNHSAGFITDDPWGDRQTPMPEPEFSQFLREGVPFARTPETAMEYSNLGFAMLGRIITNVSGQPYAATITRTLLQPLAMQSSGFFVDAAARERRALGYRWEDDAWHLEPTLAHGAFGAMGGIQTSANDYAKWVAYLLSAWPPRDAADSGPVRRATVRELAQGSNFPRLRQRPGHTGAAACREAATYGMGLWVAVDCDLGLTLSHSGGYPGYGSHVLLLPDHGAGIFAFANRTYAGPSAPVWDAAIVLGNAGFFTDRAIAVSAVLAGAYRAVGAIYQRGEVSAAADQLAMNFLMDRDAAHWARDLSALRKQVGECDTAAPVSATSALSGEFTWRCGHGRVTGSVVLAPTSPPRIQEISLERKTP
ncbi:MAG TPA: serine hydrolase domain-containing protein [Steroidobacteraceae bacterium]|nr:serine hydrolase domain-containing protein [Steroidobacteraceae bacterium]